MSTDVPTPADLAAARARVAALRSRGEIKALGEELDRDPGLRAGVEALAREAGHVPAPDWSGKRLVRAARDREAASRVRRNPIHRDEAFTCRHCGAQVPPGGARVRDHCPWCLRSAHVDEVPGDRAATCGGVLDPVALERRGDQVVIVHRCRLCGAERRVRTHDDDRVPPSLDAADVQVAPGSMLARGEDP